MEIPDLEKLNNSISVLNRTRESLGATACPDSSGHLLDKALAKQIAVRKAELDKLLPNNVSVIVRTSTPDPEVLCEDNHQNFCVQDSSEPPITEDFLLPLNNYLDCVSNQTPEQPPQVLPRHPLVMTCWWWTQHSQTKCLLTDQALLLDQKETHHNAQ